VAETSRPIGIQTHPLRDGSASWRPARFAAVVVEELTRQIISGTLPVDEVLPIEPALCEQFGFSRTVIREALKLLEERGLVRVEQGRGTTVQPRDSWNLLDPVVLRVALAHDPDMTLLDDLVLVRRVLEQEMARAAATRLTEGDLAALSENLELMRSSYGDYERFRAYDLAFHAIVMKASGNEIGLTIVRVIHQHGGVTPLLSAGSSRSALDETADEHGAILAALAARDGELAGERIASHIDHAYAERKGRATKKKT
jgi:DNA-binding FadR family transcriptional regulator